MTARPTAPDGAGAVKLMETSLGNRKLPRCCAPGPGNGDRTGADDTDPAGWKTAVPPLPHAAMPVRMPVASNATDPRRPRMVPPWPPGSGRRAQSSPALPPAGTPHRPVPAQIHLISYRTISTARSPRAKTKAGLFMAFSQVGSRTWVLTATLVTIATVAAVVVRFGLSPQAPAFCALAAAGVPLAFFDARTSRLPNVVTLPAYPGSLALLGMAAPFVPGGTGRFAHALIGMAAAAAFFCVLLVVSPAGIGMGDVKLAGPLTGPAAPGRRAAAPRRGPAGRRSHARRPGRRGTRARRAPGPVRRPAASRRAGARTGTPRSGSARPAPRSPTSGPVPGARAGSRGRRR